MMKKLLGFVILLALCANLRAQVPGFNGKRIGINVGTTLSKPLLYKETVVDLIDEIEPSILPPKLTFGLEYSVGYVVNLSTGFSYHAMPHSRYEAPPFRTSNSGEFTGTLARLKTDKYSLQFGAKVYRNFAHYGWFWNYALAANMLTTTVYPTADIQTWVDGEMVKQEFVNEEISTEKMILPSLLIGAGKKWVYNKGRTMELGVNYWYYFKSSTGAPPYDPYASREDIVHHLVYKKAKSIDMFEVFLNVGLLK